ncbi:hypothetical protein [Chitinophaga sp. S165]|uniref:hypothetical protein n=1 Tax=Chitinophaga sp. S165 TaxID=2135462 RepID=UPI000D71D926|nr:hypothetical protein [Chitinophaga sp. S165]PWV48100.1 hypothetical protein C7475_1075 [Chitinophaga sp. S165]
MKKAKVILTAIGILAIVGGALAFKARFTGSPVYVYKNIPLTTYSVTVEGRVYTLTTTRLCTSTIGTWFAPAPNGPLTTTFTNGLPAVATSGALTTPVPDIFTSCLEVPDTFTINVN